MAKAFNKQEGYSGRFFMRKHGSAAWCGINADIRQDRVSSYNTCLSSTKEHNHI